MKRAIRFLLLAFAFATSACAATKLRPLNDQLNTADADLVKAREAGRDTAPLQQQLAQIARDAAAQASSTTNPKDRVALYRVAAVAAWQAGPDGSSLVLPITDAGTAACEALPQKDKEAPRDCSLIRLARPMAVQDDDARQLMALRKKRENVQREHEQHCEVLSGAEATACRGARGKLPATDLQPEKDLFSDLETQFGKVSDVRDELRSLDVPAEFTPQTDAQRLIIYCNAVVAWRLTADTETGGATFDRLTPRKAAMAQRLQASGVAANCDPVMSMQTTPPSMSAP